jgi:hypothetical protein
MNTISILKVVMGDKTAFISNSVTQNVFPSFRNKIVRNLDFAPLPQLERPIKYRNSILSTIRFKKYWRTELSIRYVNDFIKNVDRFVIFRPALHTKLLNFRCASKSSKMPSWKLKFDET